MKITDFVTISYVIAQQDYDYVGFIGIRNGEYYNEVRVTFEDSMLKAKHFNSLERAERALDDIYGYYDGEYIDPFDFFISKEVDVHKLSIIKCETNFTEV